MHIFNSVFYDCLVNVLCNVTLTYGTIHNIQLHKDRKNDKIYQQMKKAKNDVS